MLNLFIKSYLKKEEERAKERERKINGGMFTRKISNSNKIDYNV